jgi:hypothetical protein
MDDFNARYASYHDMLKQANERNKQALFDALSSTAITHITVEFDGEGDSGQIEDMLAYNGNDQVPFPALEITTESISFGSSITRTSRSSLLKEAIEGICYDYLESTHGGWENNDGAYGTFELDVGKRSIDLEFNGRYTATETTTHNF